MVGCGGGGVMNKSVDIVALVYRFALAIRLPHSKSTIEILIQLHYIYIYKVYI